MAHFKNLHSVFDDFGGEFESIAEFKKGQVSATWTGWARMYGDFKGPFGVIKAHNKFVKVFHGATMEVNDEGLVTKFEDLSNPLALLSQLNGKTTGREEVLDSYTRYMNGKIDDKIFQHHLSDNFKITDPFGELTASGMFKFLSDFKIAAPDFAVKQNWVPSEHDFDVWVCQQSVECTISAPNSLGLQVGKHFHFNTVVFATFDHDSKISSIKVSFNPLVLMK